MNSRITVRAALRAPGSIRVPGDKSISHRALMFAGLGEGESVIGGLLPGEDCLATARAMEQLGARIAFRSPTEAEVIGNGWRLPPGPLEIDCGNSGTTMRLLAGIVAGADIEVTLTGDDSLSGRPMARIASPLGEMGAAVRGRGERCLPPLLIRGGALRPIDYDLPVASAQVKSAVLLAGLRTRGRTTVREPAPTRDHTERMLATFGADVLRDGALLSVDGPQGLRGARFHVPGDISSAAFWMVAAAARPGSRLVIEKVGLNPTRSGVIDVLRRMGASIVIENPIDQVEPYGDIVVEGRSLRATEIGGPEIPNIIDEIPILSVAAALAEGTTVIADAAELRVKESDRIASMAGNLRQCGVAVTETDDGMVITGGGAPEGGTVESYGDHRIAMAGAVLGLFSTRGVVIENCDCIATSYPGFADTLEDWQES